MTVKHFFVNAKAWIKNSMYAQMLFVALAFTLMVIASYRFMSDIERKHLQKDVKNAILNTEARIKAEMLEPETILAGISETIRSMVLLGFDADTVNRYIQSLNDYVQSTQESRLLGVNGFYGFFDIYGGMFITGDVNWMPPDDYELENRPWYIAAVEADGDIGVTQPYFNIASGEFTITFVRRIFDEKNKSLGIVCLNMFLDRIRKLAIDTQFAENGYGFLLNQDMELIAHPDSSLLGVKLRNVRSYIAAYEDDLRQNDHVYELTTTDYRNIKAIVFIEKLQNSWYMGVVTPRVKYYQSIINMAIVLAMLGTVLAAILIIILTRISAEKNKADERMRIMFDAMPLGANIHNKNFDFFDCNEGAVKMFGASSKQEYREKFFQFSPEYQPDGRLSNEKKDECIDKAFTDGYFCFEWMHRNLNDEPIPCEVTLVRVRHNNEFAIAAYMRDLRELKQMMKEVERREHLLSIENAKSHAAEAASHILENILNGIDAQVYVSVPHSGEILFVNNYMKKQFKIEGDCAGKYCYKIFQKDMDGICDFCPCYKLDKEPGSTVVWEEHNSITNRVYRNTNRYIEWSDGRIVLIQHSVDVTELISAKEQAIQANKDKSSFLAKMSHEIRTPMNAILGITEIQLENETLAQDTQEAFGEIYNSGYLLLGIINDILDLSKIEAGKLELYQTAYDVPSLINDTVHLNVMKYDSKPIEFKLHVDENIPSTLFGDQLRIRQILNNLLSNAFKYTNEGEISFSVSAEYGQREKPQQITLVFRVSDTGQGMTTEQLARLFDEYTRFNAEANRTTEGSGLGMTITRHLVGMMGGVILVDSEPARGSTFTVRLPQGIVDDVVMGKVVADNLKQFHLGKAGQLKKAPQIVREYMPYGRILIVDDVNSNLYVARGLMAPYGLTVETATSGFEAVEKIRNGAVYDIIFMDHMMPKMDGIETVKIIRGMGYTHPIIALTANALTGQAEMFMENGFDGFISKPIDIRQLNLSLNKFIRDKRPGQAAEM